MQYDPDALENLRMAVVTQAVRDYKDVINKLKKRPDNAYLKTKKRKIEADFRSQYFCILAGIDDGDEFASLIRSNINVRRNPECRRVTKKRYERKENKDD